MLNIFAVIASDGVSERCEGLFTNRTDGEIRCEALVGKGLARFAQVMRLEPATDKYSEVIHKV